MVKTTPIPVGGQFLEFALADVLSIDTRYNLQIVRQNTSRKTVPSVASCASTSRNGIRKRPFNRYFPKLQFNALLGTYVGLDKKK